MYNRHFVRTENFQDFIARLYGNEALVPVISGPEPISSNGGEDDRISARTITFQVTDACNLACTYCLTKDTYITMADGSFKSIKDVKVGDVILAFDENNPEDIKPATVEQLFKRTAPVVKLKLDDHHCLRITPNHKIAMFSSVTNTFEWHTIDDVRNDLHKYSIYVYDIRKKGFVLYGIHSVTYRPQTETVYNIGTSTHTYIANDIAVHNCYQINKKHHSMSFDVAKRYADYLLESETYEDNPYVNQQNSSGLIIEFIGGEPFLEIDLIDKITDYMINKMIEMRHPWLDRFMISICSNGVMYFDPRVQAYIKKHKRYLSFSVSIDGNKELHDSCRVFPDGRGSYDIAIQAVDHYRNVHHGNMGSKMTLAPQNISHAYDAVRNLIALDYKEIFLNCVYEKGWTTPDATVLFNQLCKIADYLIDNDLFDKIYLSIFEDTFFSPKDESDNQNWCGGTGAMLSCDWKGDLYPCIRYMESSLGTDVPPMIIGDVYNGLMHTDAQKNCVNCLKSITRRSQSTDECFYCPIANGCSWCSAYNYQENGTADKRATYICVMHKARALANLYYWNKGFKKYAPFFRMKNYVPDEWALEIITQEQLDEIKRFEVFTDEDYQNMMSHIGEYDKEYQRYVERAMMLHAPVYTNQPTEKGEK